MLVKMISYFHAPWKLRHAGPKDIRQLLNAFSAPTWMVNGVRSWFRITINTRSTYDPLWVVQVCHHLIPYKRCEVCYYSVLLYKKRMNCVAVYFSATNKLHMGISTFLWDIIGRNFLVARCWHCLCLAFLSHIIRWNRCPKWKLKRVDLRVDDD